ncbi:AcrR family transcriptional regulator [Lipingzhangella halophila]|uniref:AcrR family transcriptional regulator n=1 Tax=Lipingzhangella halophila TaxID=1783352 RepID=A0A7W7RKE7_9ACTN|nr:TetR/AcrR family transcriptional regulator [Lipingzhangella halophila]MBB4933146.1 AcrR family transcriptional regulator [Lipingzhangella halophila]
MPLSRVSTTTRELLILVAERLFAANGIGGVSLREIGIEAGQRNTSVTHYYFGNKDALVRAIFEYRMEPINAHRVRMLREIREAGREGELRALLEALVFPIACGIIEGGHYGQFLAHLQTDPSYRGTYGWAAASGLREVCDHIAQTLDGMPHEIRRNRIRMLRGLVTVTAGEMEQRGATAKEGEIPPWALDLVDAAMGLLTAPYRAEPLASEDARPVNGERGGAGGRA